MKVRKSPRYRKAKENLNKFENSQRNARYEVEFIERITKLRTKYKKKKLDKNTKI